MSTFAPIRCVTWETTAPPTPGLLRPNAAGRILVLATHEGRPRVHLDVEDAADEAEVAERVRRALAATPAPTPARASRPPHPEPVTVVICSLGREPRLRATVRSVLAESHDLHLLVVDNDPTSGQVEQLLHGLDDPRLQVVPEPRRGLSRARNTGLLAAVHPLVAFTDDDAEPAPGWVAALADAFVDPTVTCVTGLVLPADLTTRDQAFFEEAGGFDKGLQPQHWTTGAAPDLPTRPGPQGAAFPFDGGFGSGNNMAFRTGRLRSLGGFDVALGAGSPTRGGEDLDIFQRVHLAGDTIAYWPAAVVRHHHRTDRAGLVEQMHGYGVGMAAVVTKRMLTSPRHALGVLVRLPGALRLLLAGSSEKNHRKTASFPPEVTRAELRGYASGPLRYLWAAASVRWGR